MSSGTIRVGNNKALGTGTFKMTSGSLQAVDSTARTIATPIEVNGDRTLGGAAPYNGTLNFAGPWSFPGSCTPSFASDASISNSISLSAGVTFVKAGTGVLILYGDNKDTMLGTLDLSAGKVRIGYNATNPDYVAGSGTLIMRSNTTLSSDGAAARTIAAAFAVTMDGSRTFGETDTYTGDLNFNGTFSLGSTPIFLINNTTTFNGALVNNINWTKTGPGTMVVNAASTATGTKTISAGTLVMGHSDALGPSGTITVSDGAMMRLKSGVTLGRAITFNSGASLGGAGTFSTGSALTVAGQGRVQAGDAAVGTLTLANGLTLNSTARMDAEFKSDLSANDLVNVSGGTLTLNAGSVYIYTEGTTNRPNLPAGASYNLFQYAALAGAANKLAVANPDPAKDYYFSSDGTYVKLNVLDGANRVTTSDATSKGWNTASIWSDTLAPSAGKAYEMLNGAIVVGTAGSAFGGSSLQIDSGATLSLGGSATNNGPLVLNGGKVSCAVNSSFTPSGNILNPSTTSEFNITANNTALSGQISGEGALRKTGAGQLTINAVANTYTGGTTLDAGTLYFGDRAFGTGTITVNGGALYHANVVVTLPNAIVINGNMSHDGSSDKLTINGPATFNNRPTLSVKQHLAFGGNVTDGGNGVVLSAYNSYHGWIYFNADNSATLTGGITVSNAVAGNYCVLVAGTNNAFGLGTVTMAYGATGLKGGGMSLDNPLKLFTNVINDDSSYTLNGNLIMGGNHMLEFSGGYNKTITFNGTFLNEGAGAYTLSVINSQGGAQTFTVGGSGKTHTAALKVGGPNITANLTGSNNTFSKPTTFHNSTASVTGMNNAFSGVNVRYATATLNSTTTIGGPVTVLAGALYDGGASYGGSVVTLASSPGRVGVLGLNANLLPTLAASPSGVLAINHGAFNQSLAGLAGTDVYIGSTNGGVFAGTSLPVTAGAYQLGGAGGTLTLDVPSSTTGALTGGNNVTIGRNGGGTDYAGSVTNRDNNDFTGSLTVNPGSTLTALLTDLASGAVTPFGGNGSSGAIALNGGTLKIDKGSASAGTRTIGKGALTYAGSGTVTLTGDATHAVQLTVDTLVRDTAFAAGLVVSGASALGSNEKFIVANSPPARSASTGRFMVEPYMVHSDGAFLDYPDANGFALAGVDYAWNSSADGSAIVATDIVKYTYNGAIAKNGTITCKAFNAAGGIALNGNAGGASKLVITSGGLSSSGGLVYIGNVNANIPIQFGPDEGLLTGCVFVENTRTFGIWPQLIGAGLTKYGAGTLSLYSTCVNLGGTVTVAGGILVMHAYNTSGAFGGVSEFVLNGGTMQFVNHVDYMSQNIRVGPQGGTLLHQVNNANFGFSGNILKPASGSSGILTLSCANSGNAGTISGAGNTYDGGTIVQGNGGNNCRINVADGSSLGTGPVEVYVTGLLYFYGDCTIDSLWGVGNVTVGNNSTDGTKTLTIGDADNRSSAFYGVIANYSATKKGGIVKAGTGTLELGGANTYTGPTAVNAGKLLVTGSLSTGGVSVAAAVALGGSGSIGGAVSVAAGGIMAPGDGVGSMTISTNLAMAGDAVLECEFSATTNDVLRVNGTLTLGSSTTLKLVNAGLTQPEAGRDYVLVEYTGTAPALGTWTVDPGSTGWRGRVFLNEAQKQIVFRFSSSRGTVFMFK